MRPLILALLLAACGGSTPPPEPAPAPQDLAAAEDNEPVLAGVSTSAASVPKNSAVEFSNEGSVLAKIDSMVALVLGKEMTAGAAGIARPRVMGDAGAIVGTNKSASPVVLAGVSYAEIALDIREPA